MLASLEEPPLAQRGLVYEPKYDGIRAIVDVRPAAPSGRPAVAIYSRNGNDKTPQFPAVVSALEKLAGKLAGPILLDGELVAVDSDGRALGFQHIQGRIHLTSPAEILRAEAVQPVVLRAFDLLRDGDEDLRGLPLAARRLRLQRLLRVVGRSKAVLGLSELIADDGRALAVRAHDEDWEGLIVKDGQSVYHSGRRTPSWRKYKLHKTQELVVGGWTEPRSMRSYFGALLVGYYDEAGALRWAGSVGTGFDEKELRRVFALLQAREIPSSPFADAFKTMERPHWVTPDLVVQVRFTEWTADDLLRHPVYLGTRDDKPARSVRREGKPRAAAPALTPGGRYKRNRREPKDQKPTSGVISRNNSRRGVFLVAAGLLDELVSLERQKKDADLLLPSGDRLRVTNLAKPFWKKLGITKGDLLRYYVEVAPLILPAIDDRPMVMKRFPNGVDGMAFYQQRHPETPPPGVRRVVLPEDVEPISEEGPRDRIIGGSLTTLLYMTQLAAISQDPWFSTVSDPFHPDAVAIDLDPGEGATFEQVLDVARWVKEEMDRLRIPGVPKTSGASGLHIYVPLPPDTTYETGQILCQVVATLVATKHPRVATVERMVKRRPRATVYVDYLQNILGKTIATAYSARASDYAGVSTPLTWEEISRGFTPQEFTIRTAPDRFRARGDLWAAIRGPKRVNIQAVLDRIK